MNHIADEGFFNWATRFSHVDPMNLCFLALSKFPEVENDKSERSLAMDLLLRFIRNTFLHDSVILEKWYQQYPDNEAMICTMINLLELCGTFSDCNVVRRRAYKMSSRLWSGNRRDTVKFVAKRLPCTCLKKLHSAARKKLEKVGSCFGCNKQFPRSQLYVCTGCMIVEYCSKECQRAHWSHHKEDCGHPELVSRDLPADYVLESNVRGS